MRKGQRARVPTPGTSRKRSVFGALEWASGRWHYAVGERKRTEEFLAFREQLLLAYPGRPLVAVLDNASSHTARAVGAGLAEHPQVQRLFLPTSSGHRQNPVGKVWWRWKGYLAARRLHGSIDALAATVHQLFASFTPEESASWPPETGRNFCQVTERRRSSTQVQLMRSCHGRRPDGHVSPGTDRRGPRQADVARPRADGGGAAGPAGGDGAAVGATRDGPDDRPRLGLAEKTVRLWVERFTAAGLDGLEDGPRSGRPHTYTEDQRSRVIAKARALPPKPEQGELQPTCHWTLDRRAAELNRGGGPDQAEPDRRVLKAEHIEWQKPRTWLDSDDPQFAEREGTEPVTCHPPGACPCGTALRMTIQGASQLP